MTVAAAWEAAAMGDCITQEYELNKPPIKSRAIIDTNVTYSLGTKRT